MEEHSLLTRVKKFFFPTKYDKEQMFLHRNRVSFYRQFIQPGDICYDIGANFGNRTSVFLELGAKVVALEPQKKCFDFLVRRFSSKAIILRKGVGEKSESRDFFVCEDNSPLSSFSKDWIAELKQKRFAGSEWNMVEKIEMTTLDLLIKQYGVPGFIKIDVEGFELEVIKGLTSPFNCLSFEYAVPENTATLNRCLAVLSATYDKIECNYVAGENTHLELTQWLGVEEMNQWVLSAKFKESFAGDIYVRLK
jgi:FkbM family methyltransferase